MVTTRNSTTLARSRRMTVARVAFDAALCRLGCSITYSLATGRDHTIAGVGVHHFSRAGVVELADTPALGAGGASRGGSNPSARMTASAPGCVALAVLAAAHLVEGQADEPDAG